MQRLPFLLFFDILTSTLPRLSYSWLAGGLHNSYHPGEACKQHSRPSDKDPECKMPSNADLKGDFRHNNMTSSEL